MKHIYIVLFLFIFLNCQHEPKSEVKKTIKAIKKKENNSNKKTKKQKVKKIELDTINDTNTVNFLKTYGNKNQESIILIKTRLGNLKIKLYKETPLHRASFVFLTKTGYFSTTSFHRIVKDFIVQGGNSDLPITRKLRIKYKNYKIPAEILENKKHKYGALAAAREWDNNPNKVSSPFEFYIIQRKNGSHHLDGEHTIFGEIIEGFSTLEKIANLETDKKEWPIKEVFIKASVIK